MTGALAGPRVPAHQVTTRHLGAAYPLLSSSGLGARGALIGRDLLGAVFTYDPFELYADGRLSNPNMIVLGQIGRGKSAFVKTYLWRQAVFGRRAWVVDPKGEYGSLARRWGVRPITLRPGGSVRLNPLDLRVGTDRGAGRASGRLTEGAATAGPNGHHPVGDGAGDDPVEAAERRRIELAAALATAALGRDLRPRERTAIELALIGAARTADVVVLPQLVERLLDPLPDAPASVRTDRQSLVEDGRDAALELRRLVHGDLRGMFDGPTTPGLDMSGPLVALDLSALYDSAALGILMTCATAWLQAAAAETIRRPSGDRVLLVVDEAWAILSQLAVARWLQASWKLSRARGVANVAVLHRVSDLSAVGAAGSQEVSLASGLLADSETRVVYAQPPGEVGPAGALLSLSSTEAELLPQLRRGVALWKVGSRPFLVQHVLSPGERELVDTDAAMSASSRSEPPVMRRAALR